MCATQALGINNVNHNTQAVSTADCRDYPCEQSQALVLLNGDKVPLADLPFALSAYALVVCVDGAWNQLVADGDDEKVHQIIGDGDSILDPAPSKWQIAHDQSTTDFEKTLLYLDKLGFNQADIYWGSGGEMDHFLGNLAVAARYHDRIRCVFYDQHQAYFFTQTAVRLHGQIHQTITLYPFPAATVSSDGLRYELHQTDLAIKTQQSLRNEIIETKAHLTVNGDLWVFITR